MKEMEMNGPAKTSELKHLYRPQQNRNKILPSQFQYYLVVGETFIAGFKLLQWLALLSKQALAKTFYKYGPYLLIEIY